MFNKNKLKGFFSGIVFSVTFCAIALGFNVFAAQDSKDISAENSNIKIYVDGELMQPTDSNGKITKPFMSNGYVCLPIETLSKLLGKEFIWDAINNSVYLGKKPETKVKEVTVSNVEELYNQLGSNKKIKLKPGIYNLSKIKQNISSRANVSWEDVFDGKELIISSVENLTLEGLGSKPVEIVVEPRYADVLTFNGCNNITIKNIKAGHTIEKGYCSGGVLNFDSTKNINIADSIFYGCGSIGITASKSENLTFNNSIIEECTTGIMQIDSCKNFKFTNSIFRKCQDYSMISLYYSTDIVFEKCELSENTVAYDYASFISMDSSQGIKFLKCNFKNNVFNNFGNTLYDVEFSGSTFEGNSLYVSKSLE